VSITNFAPAVPNNRSSDWLLRTHTAQSLHFNWKRCDAHYQAFIPPKSKLEAPSGQIPGVLQ